MMLIDVDGKRVRLPDFLIVGAARSGTSSLCHYLRQHPDIYIPAVKEPLFFTFMRRSIQYTDFPLPRFACSLPHYLKLFEPARDNQTLGEASTTYLYAYKETIGNVRRMYGKEHGGVKIIVILRNPVDRAISHYNHLVQLGIETLPLREAMKPGVIRERLKVRWDYDYVGMSMYAGAVEAFLRDFRHTKVYLFEELDRPGSVVTDLLSILGVQGNVTVRTTFSANRSGLPRNKFLVALLARDNVLKRAVRSIVPDHYRWRLVELKERIMQRLLVREGGDPIIRRELASIFREDIQQLQSIIGRDLTHWLDRDRVDANQMDPQA